MNAPQLLNSPEAPPSDALPSRGGLMPGFLRDWLDRLLGRGSAACTVPTFDGVLKPNQALERAELLARFDAPNDLATDGRALFIADGKRILRFAPSAAAAQELAQFDEEVTAIACQGSQLAFALGGKTVLLRRLLGDGQALASAGSDPRWDSAAGKAFVAVNALAFLADGSLLATDGSARFGPDRWCHDLMSLGRSGRVCRLDAGGQATEVASKLSFAFGALPRPDGSFWLAESWAHRLLRFGGTGPGNKGTVLLDRLPGYPSRLSPAADGGAWLTCFTGRTQLVEFVLREKAYRERMVAEIDPRYWVAPALSSGNSFLEPLQGAGVKTMGVLKPWAPPRSYGLVIRLDAQGRPTGSLHSRVGGRQHGIVAAVELGNSLYVLAKGSGAVLRLPLDSIARLSTEEETA